MASPFVKTRFVRTGQDRIVSMAIAISIIAIAVRFIGINQPFDDRWSWRQSDVAAMARNYFHNGFHFASPQIDWAGNELGYVGTEFPLLPFVAAICYKFAGVHEWIGRIQSVIFFAVSLPFFFLLVRRTLGASAALWALFFYSFAPLNLMASRCFMPDVPSLSLSIIGLYFFLRWTENDRYTFLLGSAVAISLSLLLKLPSAIIGAPLVYLAVAAVSDRRSIDSPKSGGQRPPLQKSSGSGACIYQIAKDPMLWLFAAFALLPSALWYWHAHEIAERFYPHHFFGAGGVRLMNASWYWKIIEETVISGLTPLLVGLAILVVFARGSVSRAGVFLTWLAATVLFVIVVGYGNRHPWYRLPLVPIGAALAGAFCGWIGAQSSSRFKFKAIAAIIVVLFGILSYVAAASFYHESAANLRALGSELKRTTPEKSLVIAADYGDPTVFYYAERKGWHFLEKEGIYNGHPLSDADAILDFEELKSKGATHFALYSSTFWWLDYYEEFAKHLSDNATLEETTAQFKIYRLNPKNPSPSAYTEGKE